MHPGAAFYQARCCHRHGFSRVQGAQVTARFALACFVSGRMPALRQTDFEDMTRFNEAIDQAIVESVDFFSKELEQARNLFLGMLGHDLRTPLNTIQMTSALLCNELVYVESASGTQQRVCLCCCFGGGQDSWGLAP